MAVHFVHTAQKPLNTKDQNAQEGVYINFLLRIAEGAVKKLKMFRHL